MQPIAYIVLAVLSSIASMNIANAGWNCNQYTPVCGTPAAQGWQVNAMQLPTKQAAADYAKANTGGGCKAIADTKINAAQYFTVNYCRIPNKDDIAAAKAKAMAIKKALALAADPTSSLDCKKLKLDSSTAAKATGNPDPYADIVADPTYYYDSMKGVRAAYARLNDFVRNSPVVSYDQGQALQSLSLMNGWLAPTDHQYHEQVSNILNPLNSCFNNDCKRFSLNDLDGVKTLNKVKEAMAGLAAIESDMKSKLALLKPCDAVVQTASLNTAISLLKTKVKTNTALIGKLSKSAVCESSTAAAAPMPANTSTIPALVQSLAPAPAAAAPAVNVPFVQGPAPAAVPPTANPAIPADIAAPANPTVEPYSVDFSSGGVNEQK